MPRRTLVLIRHSKSDWSGDEPDHDRPLNKRGRRQGREAGRWLAEHVPTPQAALVSSAERARQTWSLVADQLTDPPEPTVDGRLYAFAPGPLLARVQALPASARSAALVGHNPGIEDLLDRLLVHPDPANDTCLHLDMKTSGIAVVSWSGAWSEAGEATTRLEAHGRPPS